VASYVAFLQRLIAFVIFTCVMAISFPQGVLHIFLFNINDVRDFLFFSVRRDFTL
jgi:hypothetical protein